MENDSEKAEVVHVTPTPKDWAKAIDLDKTANRAKARLYLAGLAIVRLQSETPLTRNQLFAPAGDHEDGIKSIPKEGMGRSWQNDFLEMLTAANLAVSITGPSGKMYVSGDNEKRALVVYNMLYGNQSGLKLLLWPKDYDAPTAAEIRDASEQPIEEEEDEEVEEERVAPAEPGPSVDVISKVAERLSEVAQHLGELYRQTQKSTEATEQSGTALTELASRMESALGQMERVAGEEKRRLYAELSELVTKMNENEIRKKSLMNQLEAESRRSEATMQKIKELLERVT